MQDFIQQFLSHNAGPIMQFIKYGMAGVFATAVDMAVFYALSWLINPALRENDPVVKLLKIKVHHIEENIRSRRFVTNSVISFMFSTTACYIVNVLWVFEPGRHSRYVEVALFYGVSAISVFVGTFVGWLLIRKFHLSTTSSYIAKIIASLMLNYVCRKFIIFKG